MTAMLEAVRSGGALTAQPRPPLVLTRRRGRVELRLVCVAMGRDLSVTLDGGDRPHIGAVAVAQPRPSHRGGGRISATTSVIALLGHLEDELARSTAHRLASGLDATVSVACGIHLDQAGPDDLREVRELAEELATELLAIANGS